MTISPDFADPRFTYDFASNRDRQMRDTDGDGLFEPTDETTEYVYDANDRLLEE